MHGGRARAQADVVESVAGQDLCRAVAAPERTGDLAIVRPAVAVEIPALFHLERPLRERDLGGPALPLLVDVWGVDQDSQQVGLARAGREACFLDGALLDAR